MVKRSTSLAVAVIAAVALVAVDDEDVVQWQRWGGGHSIAAAAFDGNVNELWVGDGKAKMVIDTSGGRWRRQASAF
jgi:hypothetical protein